MTMYNAEYHPISKGNLDWMLLGESKENQDIILAEVEKAKANKTRNYLITLLNGDLYQINNGQVIGSKNTAE